MCPVFLSNSSKGATELTHHNVWHPGTLGLWLSWGCSGRAQARCPYSESTVWVPLCLWISMRSSGIVRGDFDGLMAPVRAWEQPQGNIWSRLHTSFYSFVGKHKEFLSCNLKDKTFKIVLCLEWIINCYALNSHGQLKGHLNDLIHSASSTWQQKYSEK